MRNMRTSVSGVLVSACLAGCTTQLSTRHDGDGPFVYRPGKQPEVRVGVDYAIPMLQFRLKTTRVLKQCTEAGAPSIRFVLTTTAEPVYVAGERFVIDYNQLSGWSKTSKIDLETYGAGTIKGLNASAQDRTGAIIGSVVKAAVRVASIAQGGIPPLAADKADKSADRPATYVCTTEAASTIDLVEQTAEVLKGQTSALVAATDKVGLLERLATLGALTDAQKKELADLALALPGLASAVGKTSQDLTKLQARITVEDTMVWPRSPDEVKLDEPPSEVSRRKLLGLFVVKPDAGLPLDSILRSANVTGRLVPAIAQQDKVPECAAELASCAAARRDAWQTTPDGLLYRNPVMAHLLVCDMSKDSSCDPKAASGTILLVTAMAPQFGKLRLLPYRNGAFQNNELKVTFREDGSLATLAYEEKAARGEVLGEALAGAGDELLKFAQARNAFRKDKAAQDKAEADAGKKAALDDLDNEIARLQKQQQITQLIAQGNQDGSVEDVKAETAQVNAQVALLEARKKLLDAQAALNPKN